MNGVKHSYKESEKVAEFMAMGQERSAGALV